MTRRMWRCVKLVDASMRLDTAWVLAALVGLRSKVRCCRAASHSVVHSRCTLP